MHTIIAIDPSYAKPVYIAAMLGPEQFVLRSVDLRAGQVYAHTNLPTPTTLLVEGQYPGKTSLTLSMAAGYICGSTGAPWSETITIPPSAWKRLLTGGTAPKTKQLETYGVHQALMEQAPTSMWATYRQEMNFDTADAMGILLTYLLHREELMSKSSVGGYKTGSTTRLKGQAAPSKPSTRRSKAASKKSASPKTKRRVRRSRG